MQREKNDVVRDIRHPATGYFLAGGVSFALCLYGWLDTPARSAGQCRLLVVGETNQRLPYRDDCFCGRLCILLPVCRGGQTHECPSFPVEKVQEADNPLLCLWDNILCPFLLPSRAVPPVCGFLACCQRGFASVVSAYAVLVFFGLLAD